ncbi:MAG: hypothetical protein EP344_09065 [Bacteroidetes bacterium]|nr:MAG: hypothetical protein EP344_09065 [Bacteroidota bacterium]
MKNVFLTLTAFTLIALTACNKIDSALVEKIQASQNKAQEIRTEMEARAQNVSNLNEQMEKAPEGLKGTSEFMELYNMVNGFTTKYGSIQAELDSINTKLETLLGDYADGNLKKDEVVVAHEAIVANLDSYQPANDRLDTMFDELSARFAKMTANWQGMSEEERTAAVQKSASEVGAGTGTGAVPSPTSTGIPGSAPATGGSDASGTLKGQDQLKKQ